MTAPAHPGRHPPLPPDLPPGARGRVALGLTAAAATGRFALQTCADCGAVQYPPREACHRCLSPRLPWRDQDGAGELLSDTTLHHSHHRFFRARLPWRLGLVRLDAGPSLMVHLHGAVGAAPARVRVAARLDRSGQAVLVAGPTTATTATTGSLAMADDSMLRELGSDPSGCKLLVTDGQSPVGQALVRALLQAGADRVWAGQAAPDKTSEEIAAPAALAQVTPVPLDVGDARSVAELAAALGPHIDIVINNAELRCGSGTGHDSAAAHAEMDINYFGLLRLAQAFGPALRARATDGHTRAMAWVNLLSIYALANFPPQGTYSASKAAAYSLAQCLRAEMQPAAIRVINCFPGPVEEPLNRRLATPGLAPEALAQAIVRALRDGVEDIYPGDLAEQWRQRWRDDPKVLERELTLHGS